MTDNVFSYILSEETAFKTIRIPITNNWDWNLYEHCVKTITYKYGQFLTGKNDDKPSKNIVLPILRLRYRTEGFDVKDIVLFVNEAKNYFKSFLIKKFHDKWARENSIDTFIDESSETDIDFGGVLVKNVNEVRPEVVPWQRVAFCDQTDILSGPICEKHNYAPDQLKEMEKKGWKNIDNLIALSKDYKVEDKQGGKQSKTPGKYIEVYELHGILPRGWLDNKSDVKENDYVRQIQIVSFYKTEKGEKQGITLFSGKEKESPYKFRSDTIYNRALGYGGVEELIESQVWINYDLIHIKNMLDAASKIIHQTTDQSFKNKNKLNNLENNEVLVTELGTRIDTVNTQPVNIVAFDNSIVQWEAHARQTGAATESLMGDPPSSGTPFKLQELITQTSMGLHEYRMGKYAVFIEEIYRDWIIPYIVKEITKGQEFLSELSLDELTNIADNLVMIEANKLVKEKILNGELIDPAEIETYKQQVREEFMKGGNKRFLQIFKDELKDAPVSVQVNIKGKQKNLALMTEKLVNVFRQIIAAPQVLDDPRMAKLFNQILEASGLNPMDFYQKPQSTQPQPNQPTPPVQVAPAVQPVLTK